ncbi:MAG: hypothetical protein NTX56_06815 [Proteobacteria bacterium]|nr:hypothetical protein [Pseudomonadota bacterium]
MSKILTALVISMFSLSTLAAYAPKTEASTVEATLASVATAKADVKQGQSNDMVLAKKGGKKKKTPKA